jgi:hypothetical protein
LKIDLEKAGLANEVTQLHADIIRELREAFTPVFISYRRVHHLFSCQIKGAERAAALPRVIFGRE